MGGHSWATGQKRWQDSPMRMATFRRGSGHQRLSYIKQHANDASRSSWMSFSSRCITRPMPRLISPASRVGDYCELAAGTDADIGKLMDEIRGSPNTIVIVTADNGAWLTRILTRHHAVPRRKRGSPFEGGWRVPGLMWWPGHIAAGAHFDEMMSHIDPGQPLRPWSAYPHRRTMGRQ